MTTQFNNDSDSDNDDIIIKNNLNDHLISDISNIIIEYASLYCCICGDDYFIKLKKIELVCDECVSYYCENCSLGANERGDWELEYDELYHIDWCYNC